MALIAALVIYSTSAQKIENRYPRTSLVYRHYTHPLYATAIDFSKWIRGSADGDLGPGVYFEKQPTDNALGVSCPVTPKQSSDLVQRYNLNAEVQIYIPPFPMSTAETRAAAFVEVEITREGYWDSVIRHGPNRDGKTLKTVFQLPFLYFGPFAVAIHQHGAACY